MTDTQILTVDHLAAGGDGVARAPGGRVTFVSRTAPGDVAEVEFTTVKRSFARARLIRLIKPSPFRVAPTCEVFRDASCGGCQWQHIAIAEQRNAKQRIVSNALRNHIARGMHLAPLLTPASDFHWRRRARLHWVRHKHGRVTLGFLSPRSRHIVDVARCPQLERSLQEGLTAIRRSIVKNLYGQGQLHLLAGHTGDVFLTIEGRHHPKISPELLAPPLVGIAHGPLQIGRPVELEPSVYTTATAFCQASAQGNDELRCTVVEAVGPSEGLSIVEFYAGNGNLTRALAPQCKRILAIDSAPETNATDLAPNVAFRRERAQPAANALIHEGERFDIAVLDPPRSGAADLMTLLPKLGPHRIIYVSCDPATLARDIQSLSLSGYRPLTATPIDMMPQTAHVEVVVTLVKNSPRQP